MIGYGAYGFGQICPGQERWDASIGACNCPPGTQPTGIVGQCVSESVAVPGWGTECAPYTKVTKGCTCPPFHAYDARKQMCTKEAYGPSAAASHGAVKTASFAGLGIGSWFLIAAIAGGAAYLIGRESNKGP